MGKILRKIKDFCKRYIFKNKLISIAVGIIIVGVLLFVIFNRNNVDSIRKVKKILSNNFYKIECMSDSCDYVIAYKGEKLGNTTIFIYNAYGKKIASYKENFKTDNKVIKNIFSVADNYIIFKKEDVISSETKGYLLTDTRIKTKYSSENVLSGLNDYLISEKLEDTYNIINNNGKTLYTNVKDINVQADGKIISINFKKEDLILNEKGDIILNGYRIVKQVKNADSKVIYLVLQDSNKNAYYYYNIKNNEIVGDSFNGYVDGSNAGELIITKKENNESVKYILRQDGSTKKLDSISMDSFKNIDLDKYDIVYDSYILPSQKVVLVYSGNSFGTYNLETNKYTELYKYEELKKNVYIGKLLSNEKDLYLQINLDGKSSNKLIVYDMVNDKSLYEMNTKEYKIQYFTNYGDYNVVKYSSDSNEEYKNRYAVYNKDNKEIFKSNDQIVIIDKEYVFGKEYTNYSLILFSAKSNKALNDSDSLATKVTLGKSYFYKYNDSTKTYLFNSQGDRLKVINTSKTSLMYSTETLMYLEGNKIYIINPTDNKTSVYTLSANEKINTYDGESIPPYRNTLFINNTIDNNIKIVNVKGKVIKNIKNSIIESVDYNKHSNNVIIITRQVKDNNNYYGLYLGK
jgi:hypothetical protein